MTDTTAHDGENDLGFQIDLQFKRIINETHRCRESILFGTGLTPAQCFIIEYLGVQPGRRASQREIERHLHVQHSTASGIIKRMEKKGLVRCVPNESDKRVKDIYLTQEADQFKPLFCQCNRNVREKMTNSLNQADQRELSRLLDLVLSNFEQSKKPEETETC